MEYLDKLDEYNSIEGSIIDTDFNKLTTYIDLASAGTVKRREYYIINSYEQKPWQPAFDYANSIKNKIKKHSKFIRETINEGHLDLIKDYAIAIFNAEKSNLNILRITYNRIKAGGVIIVKTSKSVDVLLAKLTTEFPRSILRVEKTYIAIRKSNEVGIPKAIKRSNSKLT